MSAATPATPLPPMKLAGLEPVLIGDDSLFNTHYATLRTAAVGPLAADASGAGT